MLAVAAGHCGSCVFGAAEGKYEAEGVFAVQVEPVETFFRDEAEGGVEPEGGHVVEFSFERDLVERVCVSFRVLDVKVWNEGK